MADFTLARGNQLPVLRYSVPASELGGLSLAGATAVFRLAQRTNGTKVIDAAATVDDALGVLEWDPAAGDADLPGRYKGWFKITFPGGKTLTTPRSRPLDVIILDDGRP